MAWNLSNKTKLTHVSAYAAASTDPINSTSVDMKGYEGVVFLAVFGTAAANNIINAAQSSDDSSFADLEGTAVGAGASDETQWLDIYRPIDRYVRCEVALGTSSTFEGCWAIQYGPRNEVVDNTTAGTIHGELHVSPPEGTK